MDWAAGSGHLEVVKWLHRNRTEGYTSKACAQNAIDSIKKNGPGAPTEDNS